MVDARHPEHIKTELMSQVQQRGLPGRPGLLRSAREPYCHVYGYPWPADR